VPRQDGIDVLPRPFEQELLLDKARAGPARRRRGRPSPGFIPAAYIGPGDAFNCADFASGAASAGGDPAA
jgi:hypothetical protein